jgi:hypothetical protein
LRSTTVRTLLLAALAGIIMSACSLRSDGAKVAIPDSYRTSDTTYTLLYSTLGYESAATKHLLIRLNDAQARTSTGLAFRWQVVNAKGRAVLSGHASYGGTAWGIPLWVADFSKVTEPGDYRIVIEAPGVQLATEPFPIDRFVMFKNTFAAIALDNADARRAPIDLDNGYFDGNTRTGTAAAHAAFLVGLLQVYDLRRFVLTQDQRKHLRDAILRGADYLLLVSDPGTGEVSDESPARPYINPNADATAQGLRGLARFAALFRAEEPDKAERAYRRARLAAQWLRENAPAAYPAPLRAAVSYDLYRYSSDQSSLDAAAAAVRELAASYDLRTMDRPSTDDLPHFEAMYRMWRDIPTHPDRQLWITTADNVAAQYRDMVDRNIFQLVLPGTTDVAEGASAVAQWDDVTTLPPPGEGIDAVIDNGWFLGRTVDAAYLAAMTGDAALEKAATASFAWLTGLNPGVPAERVPSPHTGSPFEPASFVIGTRGRAVQPWSTWEWQRTKPLATTVNGFRRSFVFEDAPASAGTSLRHDGAWIYAMIAYEDYLNAGKRPPAPPPMPPPEPAMRVASLVTSRSGDTLQILITVTTADGRPLAGAKVTTAWSGALAPGASPDDAVRVEQCTTTIGGSCLVALDAAALPVRPPVIVAVTNLEHPDYPYTPEAGPKTAATFP